MLPLQLSIWAQLVRLHFGNAPSSSPPFRAILFSAAVRIGSLAVRMATFSCAWCGGRSGRGGLHGEGVDMGRWQAFCFCCVTRLHEARRPPPPPRVLPMLPCSTPLSLLSPHQAREKAHRQAHYTQESQCYGLKQKTTGWGKDCKWRDK